MWFQERVNVLLASFFASTAALVSPICVAAENAESETHSWVIEREAQSLSDSSELTEYRASTEALSQPGVVLRVGFYPRFDCAPALTVSLPVELVAEAPPEDTLLEIVLDGEPLAWPLVVDEVAGRLIMAFHGEVAAARDVVRGLDISTRASVSLADGRVLAEFSLLGSRLAVREAQRQCVNHQPLDWLRSTKTR